MERRGVARKLEGRGRSRERRERDEREERDIGGERRDEGRGEVKFR